MLIVRRIDYFRFRKLANTTAEESDSEADNVKDNGMLSCIKAAEIALKKIN